MKPRAIETLAKTLLPGQSRRMSKIRSRSRPATTPVSASCTFRRPAARASARSGATRSRPDCPSPAASVTAGRSTRSASGSRRCGSPSSCATRSSGRSAASTRGCARAGRPTRSLWTPAEAAAFAHFPAVGRWLDALLADDDLSLSACAYARRHVSHLRWNYRYYFKSPEAVAAHADHLALIGRIERTDDFIEALLAEAGIPPERAAGLYERRHEAQTRPSKVLAGYGEGDLARLRAQFADEYAIHEALIALGRAPRAVAPAA